jgi:hypothetical protein
MPLRLILTPATPHTRGSTSRPLSGWTVTIGYPAHAGIDHTRACIAVLKIRLPRTRGDRPPALYQGPGFLMATPHTRGSTLSPHPAQHPAPGYPAHAGIDLLLLVLLVPTLRLPRTRGDRPIALGDVYRVAMATPHTRGSTWIVWIVSHFSRGYPAHAGIDLLNGCNGAPVKWLPRTRGDRPEKDFATETTLAATPHTRGSTRPMWS